MEADRKRKCYKNTIAKKNRPKSFVTDEPASKKKKRKYYADGHEDLDLTHEQFEVAKARFLQRLLENQTDRLNIEIETRAQPHLFRWIEVRKLLLTSSYFGKILNVRSKQSYTNIVEEIVYKNIQYSNTADMRHQRIYEKEGLRIFTKIYPFDSIKKCGIFIDENFSFLGIFSVFNMTAMQMNNTLTSLTLKQHTKIVQIALCSVLHPAIESFVSCALICHFKLHKHIIFTHHYTHTLLIIFNCK